MTAAKLIYREAGPSDLPQLLNLEQLVIEAERPFNAAIKPGKTFYYDLNHLLSSEDSYLIVVESEESIVGTGYAQIRKSKAAFRHQIHSYLGFMFVSPDYRGQGINQKLIDRLITWSKRKGAEDFYLDVYAENEAAIRAYKKVGFSSCMIEMKLSLGSESD
ncbi:MAG: GNAT family N-acetyltransferase [Halioglobus sp.]